MPEPQINGRTQPGDVAKQLYNGSIDPAFWPDIKRSQATQERVQKSTEELVKQVKDTPFSPPPQLIQSPNPKDYNTSPMDTFGSAAMWIAAFGSLLTKQPLASALNSGAAVMKAVNQKDSAAFDKAMEKYKIDVQNAKIMSDYQLKLYDEMMGKPEEVQRMILAASKDETGKMMFDAKAWTMHEKAFRANAAKISATDVKFDEYEQEREENIKNGMNPVEARRKAYDRTFGTSAEQKETREQQESTNLIRTMDEAIDDIKNSPVLATGAPSALTKRVEGVRGWVGGDTDPTITNIQSRLANVKQKIIQTQKGSRLKAAQERLDTMIPSDAWYSNPKEVLSALVQLRNDMILDNDLDAPLLNFKDVMKSSGPLATIHGNIKRNVEGAKEIEKNVEDEGNERGSRLLDSLQY